MRRRNFILAGEAGGALPVTSALTAAIAQARVVVRARLPIEVARDDVYPAPVHQAFARLGPIDRFMEAVRQTARDRIASSAGQSKT